MKIILRRPGALVGVHPQHSPSRKEFRVLARLML